MPKKSYNLPPSLAFGIIGMGVMSLIAPGLATFVCALALLTVALYKFKPDTRKYWEHLPISDVPRFVKAFSILSGTFLGLSLMFGMSRAQYAADVAYRAEQERLEALRATPAPIATPTPKPSATAKPTPTPKAAGFVLPASAIINHTPANVALILGKPVKTGNSEPGKTYADYVSGPYQIWVQYAGNGKAEQIQIRSDGPLPGVKPNPASILGAIGLPEAKPDKASEGGAHWYGHAGFGRITAHIYDPDVAYIAVHLHRD